VAEGRFVARIDGTVRDTLAGTATLRRSDGRLVGLELNVDSTRGVSVDLEPHPAQLRTYTAIEEELLRADRPGDTPGLVAYLVTSTGTYQTTAGRFTVSYVEGRADAVGGTFAWTMEGTLRGVPAHRSTVQVEGVVHALAGE
jgi:hypothetical protein